MAKSNAGSGLLVVVLLLGLLVGGAFNYRRNLEAETAERPRPYRTLSDAEVEQLIAAYRVEIEAWQGRVADTRDQTGGVRERAHLDARIREFERVHRSGRGERAVGQELAGRQIELEKLEEEQRLRSGSQDLVALHLRRLLTL